MHAATIRRPYNIDLSGKEGLDLCGFVAIQSGEFGQLPEPNATDQRERPIFSAQVGIDITEVFLAGPFLQASGFLDSLFSLEH